MRPPSRRTLLISLSVPRCLSWALLPCRFCFLFSLRLVLCLLFSVWLSFWLSCPPEALLEIVLGRQLCYIGQSVPSCPQMGCVGTLGLTKGFSTMTFIFFFFRVHLVLLILRDTMVTIRSMKAAS